MSYGPQVATWYELPIRLIGRGRNRQLERDMVEFGAVSRVLIAYGNRIAKCRIPAFEEELLKRSVASSLYRYALLVARCRIPEFERAIARLDDCGGCMCAYARHIAKCRIPLFEERLLSIPHGGRFICEYAEHVAKCRVPAFEEALLRRKDTHRAYYVVYVARCRIPEFELQGFSTEVYV